MAVLYDWLLLGHILAAMVWLGGGTAIAAFAVRILRTRDTQAAGGFVRGLRVIGPIVMAPGPVLVLGLGIWMVAERWEFDQTWIEVAFALFALAFLIGIAHQSRAAIAAERAATAGDDVEALRQLRRWAWGMVTILLLLVVATGDMVLKPGL